MAERRGPPPIKPGSRWQDQVEKTYWTVLLVPNKAHGDSKPIVVALGEDGTPRWFELDYWHEDFLPAGSPKGAKFILPATLPR